MLTPCQGLRNSRRSLRTFDPSSGALNFSGVNLSRADGGDFEKVRQHRDARALAKKMVISALVGVMAFVDAIIAIPTFGFD
jgi:hypothetical protein